jgi:hypothetical protein
MWRLAGVVEGVGGRQLWRSFWRADGEGRGVAELWTREALQLTSKGLGGWPRASKGECTTNKRNERAGRALY